MLMNDKIKFYINVQNGHISKNNDSEDWENRKIDWITFYRRNIHRFIQHYFKINLYPYQVLWIYFMHICDYFISIASRASAKSWLIAVYACAIAVLYPHSEIVLVSATQKMAAIIMGKIESLMEYPNLRREVENLYNNSNNRYCGFRNTSVIKVVACKDSGRGNRSTLTIGEEFRLMDKGNYDAIVKPFAIARQAPFMQITEYINLPPEEPREILISSAYHKGLWWYDETRKVIKAMLLGKNVGFIAFDYLIALYHRIKTEKTIEREKATMDSITFQEEYENIPFGENSDAYFKLSMFDKVRDIKRAFYPQRMDNYNQKKNPYDIKKIDGELRIVCVDVATRKSNENDNTIIGCIRLFPTAAGYTREISYIESHLGENTIIQAKRIKQVFYDFSSDYLVIDVAQAGIGIYDDLGVIIKDDERGIEYPAWTVMYTSDMSDKTYKELSERTISNNAEEIIYPISATSQLNNDIAVDMRTKLQKKMISFLIDEIDAEDYLIRNVPEYTKISDEISERAWYLHPYVQTSALIHECVGLSMVVVEAKIKLKESTGSRKDRYTCISYGNYFVSTVLDPRIRKEDTTESVDEFVKAVFW
jgi:hypothetical protein